MLLYVTMYVQVRALPRHVIVFFSCSSKKRVVGLEVAVYPQTGDLQVTSVTLLGLLLALYTTFPAES